jgi:hypothetical protein
MPNDKRNGRYENGKMRPVETILRMRGRGNKGELMESVNLDKINWHFCKCHNVP